MSTSISAAGQGRRVDYGVTAAVHGGAFLRTQADLLRDPLRRPVVGMDDRDQPGRAEDVAGEVTRRGGRLGAIAAALQRGPHVIADLQLGHAVHHLRRQAAVADEATVGRGQQPQAVTVRAVQAEVPVDPLGGFGPDLRPRIVGHDLGVTEQEGQVIQVIGRHFAKRQPGGLRVHVNDVSRAGTPSLPARRSPAP
jgi:hypothetical protein